MHQQETSTNQPLDVCINGPIKSIGKTIANKVFLKDPFAEYTFVNSIKAMIEAKKKISKEIIIKSFTLDYHTDNKWRFLYEY